MSSRRIPSLKGDGQKGGRTGGEERMSSYTKFSNFSLPLNQIHATSIFAEFLFLIYFLEHLQISLDVTCQSSIGGGTAFLRLSHLLNISIGAESVIPAHFAMVESGEGSRYFATPVGENTT